MAEELGGIVATRRPRRSTPPRLVIIVTLVVTLMITLVARLYYVQLLDPNKPTQTAALLHDATIVVPAPRGAIVDAEGRPLVVDAITQVVTVDRDLLRRSPDQGAPVLQRLGALLHRDPALLAEQITPCSSTVPAPCSTAAPYVPVTVATAVPTAVVLAIREHRERYPGVTVTTQSRPTYPDGDLAAHVLGYTSDVTGANEQADPALHDDDTIGVSGLEEQYDSMLRGVDGRQTVLLDPRGYTVRNGALLAPQRGDTLVTSIDARVQRLAQDSLAQQITDSRAAGKPATGGAVVVMDPQTGRIVASASYPTYQPAQFIGGISSSAYDNLTSAGAGTPLLDRAIAGQYAPGSTFKLITTSSLVAHHEISTSGHYPCPGSLSIDGRVKTNYDSESFPYPISLQDALGYSCDTFFYAPAAAEYYADQSRLAHGKPAHEWLQKMAADYGVGRSPGVDLPASEQATGSYADRETRLTRWREYRTTYCAQARRGYPDIANADQRAYLTLLASQNCTDGWRYRAGDNADMSIGQGETTMSPLQLALAYSALVNGGRIWRPTFGWAVVDRHGHVVHKIRPTVADRVPVNRHLFDYITRALDFSRGWAVSGAFAYIGSSYQNRIGGKTGTAEVEGKQDTSWLATWGPNYRDHAGDTRSHFVIVGMVEQAGTGATAAGPMLKRIWDGLLGARGKPVIAHSTPQTRLPRIGPSGVGVGSTP